MSSSYQFSQQGEAKTQTGAGVPGFNYSQGGTVSLGCNAIDTGCTTQLNPFMRFYETVLYEQALALATQQSFRRNQFSVLLDKQQQQQQSQIGTLKQNAIASYSIRLLNTSVYRGPTMKLRRDDGAMAYLYVHENGTELALYDISAASNFTDRRSMKIWSYEHTLYLQTWYDQSGNGRDFTQTSSSQQPKVMLLTSDWTPAIMLQQGSSIQVDLN
jgi:hypothetical protein